MVQPASLLCCGPEGLGFESRPLLLFETSTTDSYSVSTGILSPMFKKPGTEFEHSSLSSGEVINPLNAELNPICHLLALLGVHFLHVSRIRVKFLTLRLLMSYIYGAPILDVSRSHTTTRHIRYDSSGRVISSSQRPLPDNTRHSQQTNIHAPGGIRTQISAGERPVAH